MIELIFVLFFISLIFSVYLYIAKKRLERQIKHRSKVLSGKMIEELLPFFKEFKYEIHDLKFIGNPIDYIIFDGYSKGKIKQIVFLEIKSGKSKLNKIQNEIKKIIEKKKVKWEEFKIKN